MVQIWCWRDKERLCDYDCPAHSHYGGFKIAEPLKHLKLKRGVCEIIKCMKDEKKLPDVVRQELLKPK